MLELPVRTDQFAGHLPHRPPMIWVDEVVEISETTGICRVILDSQKNYFSRQGIRPSSLIEWMAQSYAFCAVAREENVSPIKRAFLVGITDFIVSDMKGLAREREALIYVERVREFPPLILLKGTVKGSKGKVYGSAGLKVYVEA